MGGKTPFVLVVLRPDDLGDLVEIILAHRDHPHQQVPDGYTPLDNVRWSGNYCRVDTIESLLLDTAILWPVG